MHQQIIDLCRLQVQRYQIMFVAEQGQERLPESVKNDDRLGDVLTKKRQRFQFQIRKEDKQNKILKMRKEAIRQCCELNQDILNILKNHTTCTVQEVYDLIQKIEQRSDIRQFNAQIIDLGLELRLLQLLTNTQDLTYKRSLAHTLGYLTYYIEDSCKLLNEAEMIKILERELFAYSFEDPQQSKYLSDCLRLLNHLIINANGNVCEYCLDREICKKITAKMAAELNDQPPECFIDNHRRLIQIRMNLLQYSYDKNFYFQNLTFLLEFQAEVHTPDSYLQLFLTLIKFWPQKQLPLLEQYFEKKCQIFEGLAGIADLIVDVVDEHTIPLLQILLELSLRLDRCEIYRMILSRDFLRGCLQSDNHKIVKAYLNLLDIVFFDYKQYFKESEDEIEIMVRLIKKSIDQNKNLSSAIGLLKQLSEGQFWHSAPNIMLELNIISKLHQLIKIQHLEGHVLAEALQTIISLMRSLKGKQNLDKMKRMMDNCGLMMTIEQMQDTNSRNIYDLCFQILNLYKHKLDDLSRFDD